MTYNTEPYGPYGGPPAPGPTQKSAVAAWSLGLGIAGLIIAGIPLGIAAIVCGNVEKSRARQEGRLPDGKATAGVVLGIIDIVLAIIIVAVYFNS